MLSALCLLPAAAWAPNTAASSARAPSMARASSVHMMARWQKPDLDAPSMALPDEVEELISADTDRIGTRKLWCAFRRCYPNEDAAISAAQRNTGVRLAVAAARDFTPVDDRAANCGHHTHRVTNKACRVFCVDCSPSPRVLPTTDHLAIPQPPEQHTRLLPVPRRQPRSRRRSRRHYKEPWRALDRSQGDRSIVARRPNQGMHNERAHAERARAERRLAERRLAERVRAPKVYHSNAEAPLLTVSPFISSCRLLTPSTLSRTYRSRRSYATTRIRSSS